MSEPERPPVEITWLWRRIFTYLASLANAGLLAAVILKVRDPQGLAALGLALVAANVVLATLYLAGATVTDWARIAGAARGLPKSGEGGIVNGITFGGMAGLRLALGLVAALVLALSAARLWEAGRRAGAAPLLAEASALRAQAARSALETEGVRGQLARAEAASRAALRLETETRARIDALNRLEDAHAPLDP